MADLLALEQQLRDLHPYLDYPPTPDLVLAVRTRLAAAPRRRFMVPFVIPRRLALAAAAVLILIAGLLAVPQTRNTIAHWFGVKGLIINTVPPSSIPTVSAGPLGGNLQLGQATTLAGAQAGASYHVLVPTDLSLGQPDEVYLNQAIPGGEVALVYQARPGLATASTTSVAILVMEIQGNTDKGLFGKMIGQGTTYTEVTVNGGQGFWISGTPHVFFFTDRSGAFHDETMRLATNTLVWRQGEVTVRIEGAATEAQALQIAASVR